MAATRNDVRVRDEVEYTSDRPVYMPATDIIETEDKVLIYANMPGVVEKDIEVSLEDKVLSIAGSQLVAEPEGYEQIGAGPTAGVFKRTFKLNTDIDRDKITAETKNGVLKLVLPKSEAVKPHRIAVKAG